jgi:serine/threonine protein phosphatase PrpC
MFKGWKKSKKQVVDETKPTVSLSAQEHSDYEIVVSLLSDVGCVREINEDSGRYTRPDELQSQDGKGLLVLVADGMGGHSAGEVASQMAVEVINRAFYDSKKQAREALEAAFHLANTAINQHASTNPSLDGMGTTCTALVLQDGSALAAHVGDSRLYLIRNSQIYLMTEDHSAVMEMVKNGLISLEEARHHPDKNVILRALGSHPEVEVTIWETPLPVRAGDRFLLCSDGLYDLVEDDEIKQVSTASVPHAACENLISLAKQRGGHDNITVAIVSLDPSTAQADRPTPETRQVEVL